MEPGFSEISSGRWNVENSGWNVGGARVVDLSVDLLVDLSVD